MAAIPSFFFSSSFLKSIVTPNSVVITSKPSSFFPNPQTKPLPPPVALSTAPRPPPEILSVPRTEPPSFPKEMPLGPSRDRSETDPGIPPEIIADPPPTKPVPNDPNPTPKPDGPKPPLSPPGPDIPMPPRPEVVPPRPPGPEIIPPPCTPPDISPPPTPEGPQIIV